MSRIITGYDMASSLSDRIDVLGSAVVSLLGFSSRARSEPTPCSIAKGHHPEIWPASPKDLIPYCSDPIVRLVGPGTTISESLVTLSRFMRSAHPSSLITQFLEIYSHCTCSGLVAVCRGIMHRCSSGSNGIFGGPKSSRRIHVQPC
jgi:hypothetical protein